MKNSPLLLPLLGVCMIHHSTRSQWLNPTAGLVCRGANPPEGDATSSVHEFRFYHHSVAACQNQDCSTYHQKHSHASDRSSMISRSSTPPSHARHFSLSQKRQSTLSSTLFLELDTPTISTHPASSTSFRSLAQLATSMPGWTTMTDWLKGTRPLSTSTQCSMRYVPTPPELPIYDVYTLRGGRSGA